MSRYAYIQVATVETSEKTAKLRRLLYGWDVCSVGWLLRD
jgi:hypothetical protein